MVLAARRVADERDVDVLTQARNQALRASIQEAATALVDVLPVKIAAYTVGVKDVKTLNRWASGQVTDIRAESESRLRAAYEILLLLLRFDAAETVRAWFIGMAPELDDVSPARAIHDGRLQEAMGAARAFAANG